MMHGDSEVIGAFLEAFHDALSQCHMLFHWLKMLAGHFAPQEYIIPNKRHVPLVVLKVVLK